MTTLSGILRGPPRRKQLEEKISIYSISDMYRDKTCGELRLSDAGSKVTVAGWVQRSRKMGGMTFVDVRDRYGITQVVFNTSDNTEENALFDAANNLGREYVVQVSGTVTERTSKNKKYTHRRDRDYCRETQGAQQERDSAVHD